MFMDKGLPQYKQSTRPIEGSLKVVELFETVQGEGIYIGVPSVFFRTGMCNLQCPGCDTVWDDWTETPIREIADRILSFKSKHVVFTGGEPTLWQKALGDLAWMLKDRTITVETNGAVPITDARFLSRINHFSFSPKVGSLGHNEVFSRVVVLKNLLATGERNQLKYVLDPNVPAHVDSVFAFQNHVDYPKFNKDGHITMGDDAVHIPELDGMAPLVPAERVFFQPYDRGCTVNTADRSVPGAPISIRDMAFNPNEEYNKDLRELTRLVLERSGSRFRVVPQLHKYITFR